MNTYEIINETNFEIKYNVKELIDYILKFLKVNNSYFEIIFVNNKEIKELNNKYRNINKETDVLTFNLYNDINDEFKVLGDIYISVDKIKSDAKELNITIKEELFYLVTHGMLHLLGYTHDTKDNEDIMFTLEREIINEFI